MTLLTDKKNTYILDVYIWETMFFKREPGHASLAIQKTDINEKLIYHRHFGFWPEREFTVYDIPFHIPAMEKKSLDAEIYFSDQEPPFIPDRCYKIEIDKKQYGEIKKEIKKQSDKIYSQETKYTWLTSVNNLFYKSLNYIYPYPQNSNYINLENCATISSKLLNSAGIEIKNSNFFWGISPSFLRCQLESLISEKKITAKLIPISHLLNDHPPSKKSAADPQETMQQNLLPEEKINPINNEESEIKTKALYRAPSGFVNFDSARQSQIKTQWSERGSHSKTMADEEDRFGKVAASQNSQNLTERGIPAFSTNSETVTTNNNITIALPDSVWRIPPSKGGDSSSVKGIRSSAPEKKTDSSANLPLKGQDASLVYRSTTNKIIASSLSPNNPQMKRNREEKKNDIELGRAQKKHFH